MEKAERKGLWAEPFFGALTHRDLIALPVALVAGIAVMYFALVVACLIPNEWIQSNIEQGQAVFQQEFIGQWTPIFAYGQSDKLDIGTDNLIMETLLTDPQQNAFQKAVEGYDETRYWQGYKVWLRPAFCLFTYVDLRTIMMFVLAALVTMCMLRIQKRFGTGTAAGFGAALAMGHILVVPWLFQYFEVFWIALVSMAWLLKHYKTGTFSTGKLALLFLVVGMATQYFDFLTAPVLTLCLPLAVVMLADLRSDTLSIGRRWANLIWPSTAWGIGWLVGWASKWPISTWLLRRDVLGDALHQAAYRSAAGADGSQPSVLRSLARNLFCFLPMNQLHAHGNDRLLAVLSLAMAALLLAAVVHLLYRPPARSALRACLPAAICAVIPYFWFIVLAGHTEEHYVFAYRSQIATAFLLCGIWMYLHEVSIQTPKTEVQQPGNVLTGKKKDI